MKIKHIESGEIGLSSSFNMHSLNEIIVYFDDWMDTDFMPNYEVFIEKEQKWMSFKDAFQERYLITDNYNTFFHEPNSDLERKRGYSI